MGRDETMDADTLTALTTAAGGILAGTVGGLVRALLLKENLRSGFVSVFVGAACAIYLTPVTKGMLTQAGIDVENLATLQFVSGMTGVVVVGLILDATVFYKRIKLGLLNKALPADKNSTNGAGNDVS